MYGTQYRPLNFENVLGLPVVKSVLQKVLKSEEYDPGYLFVGSYSTGKTTIARIFARSILCENRKEDMSPCNECRSCKQFLEKRHPGYLEVDAANYGTKENIKTIKESLQYESVTNYKIVLFDEAHNISKEGKDALLTQLETPGTKIILIFCTTEDRKMPKTIRSRCMSFQFVEPFEKDVVKKLKSIADERKISYEDEALHLIVRATGRHYRDAENKLRQVSLLGDVTADSVKAVTGAYDDEVVAMLATLSYDLSKSIKIADYLASRLNVRDIYEMVIRLSNDCIKYMSGVTYSSEHYTDLLKVLKKQYGNSLFEIIDYILTKNRLNDRTFFQADLLVLHYKFLRGNFEPKNIEAPKKESEDTPRVKKERTVDDDLLETIKDLQPWEREDAIRDFKTRKIAETQEELVPEAVSESWGPEKKENASELVKRKKLSKKEFGKILGENVDAQRV